MKKLLIALASLVFVVLIVGIVASFFIGSVAKQGVNTLAPKITGTTVVLDSARISPWNGSGTLSGLTIGNPPGWKGERLAYLGRMHIDVAPLSLLGDTIVVEEVIIENPEFTYETKIVASNVNDLLKQIEKNLGGSKPAEKAEPAAGSAEKKIAIKRLVLQGGKVTVGIGDQAVTVPMANLELKDLGTPENGLTSTQLVMAVAKEVVADVLTSSAGALKTMGGTTGAAAAEGVKKLGEGLKGLLGGEKEKTKP